CLFGKFPYNTFMILLQAKKRKPKVSLGKMRKNGELPAVFYGKQEKATPISVAFKDFVKVWKETGESSVVTLAIEGGENLEALIQDVDLDPIRSTPRHADFYVFEKGKKLKIKTPIEFTGVSPAVKDLGAILIKVLHELSIEALPKDLPKKIEVALDSLKNFNDTIAAKDIKLPTGVTLMEKPEEVVVSVYEPKEEAEEKPAEPVDLSAIEVEKKGKEAKEGEGTEAVATGAGAKPVGTPAVKETKERKPASAKATAGKESKGK
ncbi:MAG: 50S ribosomal protein L25, partial [Patescibacteria group bacterium]